MTSPDVFDFTTDSLQLDDVIDSNESLSMTSAEEGNGVEHTDLSRLLWIYIAPVIFFVGLIGNTLVLLVMRRRRMRGTSTSVYLRFLAVFDIFVLIVGMLPEWFEYMGILVFKEVHPITCKLEKFLAYSCSDTAIWILVIFTLDRFHALVFPFSKLDICQAHRAKYNVLAAGLMAIVKNFHVFFTRGPTTVTFDSTESNTTINFTSNCGDPEPFTYFESFVRPWIAFILVSAIPFCILLFCNMFIIKVLWGVKKLHNHQSIVTNKEQQLVQMSLMCLSASFCFLICITPSILLRIGKPYWANDSETGERNRWYDIAKAIATQLTYVNHSVNFFLYCLSGKRFRRELVCVLKCMGKDKGSPLASTESKTYVYRFNTNRSPIRSPPVDRQYSRKITGLHNSNGNSDVSESSSRYVTKNGRLSSDASPDETVPLKNFNSKP